MGFYIRKSVSVGPFRFNHSKSGVGVSAGIAGLRLGSGPRGNYVHRGSGDSITGRHCQQACLQHTQAAPSLPRWHEGTRRYQRTKSLVHSIASMRRHELSMNASARSSAASARAVLRFIRTIRASNALRSLAFMVHSIQRRPFLCPRGGAPLLNGVNESGAAERVSG